MARKKRQFEDSLYANMVSYRYYIDRFRELSISNFRWNNMPETCDVRFLEAALFDRGYAVFFREDALDRYLTLWINYERGYDIYGHWSQYRAMGYNGYRSDILTEDDSVIIYNNMLHMSTYPIADMYARRLWQLDRTLDINVKNTRQPKIILCDEKQRYSMEQLMMQVDGGYSNIFADKGLNLEMVKVLDLSAPYYCDKIYQLKTDIWNEALTYLGITNSVVNKRERLITDEVLTSQGGVMASRASRLYERQKAAERINKLFGLDVSVEYNDASEAESEGSEEPQDTEDIEEVRVDE